MNRPKIDSFTPGPWSINDWPQSNADIVIGAVGTPRIAKVLLRYASINEQKANARLIAAAPALYEALKYWFDSKATPAELAQKARAALDLVEGE